VRSPAALAILALGGCVSHPLPAIEGVRFDPIRFFYAPTEGSGTLYKLIGRPVRVEVTSISEGTLDELRVVQSIREGNRPERQRVWTIRRVGDDKYAATLTDAVGPVSVTVDGGRALIRYRVRGGFTVAQQLALQDGLVVCNRLSVRKLGIRIAWLDETIRRVPLGRATPANCSA
jgi:hypothetical protein